MRNSEKDVVIPKHIGKETFSTYHIWKYIVLEQEYFWVLCKVNHIFVEREVHFLQNSYKYKSLDFSCFWTGL